MATKPRLGGELRVQRHSGRQNKTTSEFLASVSLWVSGGDFAHRHRSRALSQSEFIQSDDDRCQEARQVALPHAGSLLSSPTDVQ